MFKHISVGGKMTVGFGIQILLILLSAVIAVVSTVNRTSALNRIDRVADLQAGINTQLEAFNEARLLANDVILLIDHDLYAAFLESAETARETLLDIQEANAEEDSPYVEPVQQLLADMDVWVDHIQSVQAYNLELEALSPAIDALSQTISDTGYQLLQAALADTAAPLPAPTPLPEAPEADGAETGGDDAEAPAAPPVSPSIPAPDNTAALETVAAAAALLREAELLRVDSTAALLVFDTDDITPILHRADGVLALADAFPQADGDTAVALAALTDAVEQYRQQVSHFASVSEDSATLHEDPAYALAGDIAAQAVALSQAVGQELEALLHASVEMHRTALIYTGIVTALALLLGVYVAVRITRLLTLPLRSMERHLVRAAETGRLKLSEGEVAAIQRDAAMNDEVGRSVAAMWALMRRLAQVSDCLERVAACDLTAAVEPLSEEDTMGLSLGSMCDTLNELFTEIGTAASQVASGAQELAASAENLAQNNSEQAAAVQELNASIAEIAGQAKRSTERSQSAVQRSGEVGDIAQSGTGNMENMLQAMEDISRSEQSIQKIVSTIDDLAFQTKILALNAAVEAARASTNGKGFAVVAGEVRNLASKSAQAAGDTAKMIESSLPEIERGIRISRDTAASFTEIIGGIRQSGRDMEEISHIIEEQSGALEQIYEGIQQISGGVQQNSSTSQETAASSEQMSAQARRLQAMIGRFTLREAPAPATSPAPAGDAAASDPSITKY